MNLKRDRIDRLPIPDDNVERFMGIIHSMVEPFGIDKISDVMHYIELLDQSVDRYLFNLKNKVSPKRKEHEDRKRFITIFEKRFLHSTDLDYSRPISAIDSRMMAQVAEKIEEKGFTVDEFLQWVFEIFLPDEPKFNPPTIHLVCTNFVVEKFLYQNKEKMKQRKEEDIHKKDALDVVNRARAVMRMYRELGLPEEAQKIIILLKKYGKEGIISLEEVRKAVEQAELNIKQSQAQKDIKEGGIDVEHGGETFGESGCANDDGKDSGNAG